MWEASSREDHGGEIGLSMSSRAEITKNFRSGVGDWNWKHRGEQSAEQGDSTMKTQTANKSWSRYSPPWRTREATESNYATAPTPRAKSDLRQQKCTEIEAAAAEGTEDYTCGSEKPKSSRAVAAESHRLSTETELGRSAPLAGRKGKYCRDLARVRRS
jgi:hypothetical protein